jgi:D-apionolactonase
MTVSAAQAPGAVKRCGTEQPDVVGRVLTAGPLTAELDGGNLRYLRVGGVEVLRALAFLVRDENWGTSIPELSDRVIDQRADGFSVRCRATCRRGAQSIEYSANIEGRADGSLEFTAEATPATDFLTARTGFVVLHPLKGVAGCALDIEHVDGSVEHATFPALVDPVQPFLNIRALTHEVMPGLKAAVRMEGDTFEMEDHRNWSDASFKTYVRPLARPWPYVLEAGTTVRQQVSLTLVGTAPAARASSSSSKAIDVTLGRETGDRIPTIGLGMPAEEIEAATAALPLVERAAPKLLICQFDPRQGHGLRELQAYRVLCSKTQAACELEVVIESVDAFAAELDKLAALVKQAGLALSAIAVCPAGDLKGVLPGSDRPPAAPLADLYRAVRSAFPGVKLGGGMFTFFTELNRTCPAVHAADDRSVMETHESLPYQVATARSFIGTTALRIGPNAIGCRDNPYGKGVTPNPGNERICFVKADPRQRGLFGAAWMLGYVASLVTSSKGSTASDLGIEAISFGAPTGPLGIIHRRGDSAVPYYDAAAGASAAPVAPAVYPAYHVFAGLARASGAARVQVDSSDDAALRCLAYRTQGATLLWLANTTARKQQVRVVHAGGKAMGIVLDEASFARATTDPAGFQGDPQPLDLSRLVLAAYAVALVCITDR